MLGTTKATKPKSGALRPLKKRSSSTDVPTADELPVTRAMLSAVRTELFERIDQAKTELRAEIQQVRVEIQEVKAEIVGSKADAHGLKAEIHGLKADMARLLFLVEEQNSRNKIVLDGLMAVIDRQNRTEQRLDQVEATVRELAAARG